MLDGTLNYKIVAFSILIFTTISIFVILQETESQPTMNVTKQEIATEQLLCTESPLQPADIVEMSSMIFSRGKYNWMQTVHTEKEIFDCRTSESHIPPQKRDVTIFTIIHHDPTPGSADSHPMVHFNVTRCNRTFEGYVISCGTFPIQTFNYNLTRCDEELVEHPLETNSLGVPHYFFDEDIHQWLQVYTGKYITSETHVYKCKAGSVQVPNKIKVMTLFSYVDGSLENSNISFLATTCVKDTKSSEVESCQATWLPRQ